MPMPCVNACVFPPPSMIRGFERGLVGLQRLGRPRARSRAGPVRAGTGASRRPAAGMSGTSRPSEAIRHCNGGGEIRTLGTPIRRTTVFKTAAFNRSATPPGGVRCYAARALEAVAGETSHEGPRTPRHAMAQLTPSAIASDGGVGGPVDAASASTEQPLNWPHLLERWPRG
jgi:hypothetical protein